MGAPLSDERACSEGQPPARNLVSQSGPRGKLVAAPRCRGQPPRVASPRGCRQARQRGKPRGSARRRALPSGQPARFWRAPAEGGRRAEKERVQPPPRSGALGSALSQPQSPPVSEQGAPQPPRQGFYRKRLRGRCYDLDRTTGRRRSSAVGRGSSSPPPPEVGLGGAVGQWRHFLRVAASRGRAHLAGAVEGRLAGQPARPPRDDRRPAAPRLPGGGAGGGRLLSEGGRLSG